MWLKFKGGKGVATYLGILFSIDLMFGFIFIVTWLFFYFIFKYSSLSSIVSSLVIPIYLLILSDVKLSQDELEGKNHVLVEGLIPQGSHLIDKTLI